MRGAAALTENATRVVASGKRRHSTRVGGLWWAPLALRHPRGLLSVLSHHRDKEGAPVFFLFFTGVLDATSGRRREEVLQLRSKTRARVTRRN